MKYVKCPIHIIHGTADKLIPFKTGIKLSQINPNITKLHPVIGGGHKNMNNFESYHLIIDDILNHIPREIDLKTTSLNVQHSKKPTKN